MRRFFYIFYYLRHTDMKKFKRYLKYVKETENRNVLFLTADVLSSVIRYKISLMDYVYFAFYKKKHLERASYAGTGFMYEYQLKMNPNKYREILEDKKMFLKAYADFHNRRYLTMEDIQMDPGKMDPLMKKSSRKIVVKNSLGQVGSEVEVLDCDQYDRESVISLMQEKGFDLLEEYVEQHPDLMGLSPSGLNTVRVITQITNSGEVVILGARLRVSVNSQVDNLGAGNLAAMVDEHDGTVSGPGIFSDISKEDLEIHPITNTAIKGFKIPYWKEVLDLAHNAALHHPENRSIGWDIAVTRDGPELIEGNHNWCKLLWQLPAKQGLKHELCKYIS